MDIILTHGYFLQEDEMEQRIMKPYPPLGILYISSYLKSRGFEVKVCDNTFKTKSDFFRFIEVEKPSLVGIYVNLMTKLNVLEMIRYCKQLGSTVIVGGPDVPEYAEYYVRFGADVAVLGEGEETMEELIPALIQKRSLRSIAGIVFMDDQGDPVRTPQRRLISDLDSLPFPDREATSMPDYIDAWKRHHGMGSLSLICARGCPYTCTWCSRSIFGESHRRRSVVNVVNEVELLLSTYHPDMLWFADDVFTIHHGWFNEFYEEMVRRNLRVPFECITRADRLNEDILKKMAALGAFRIWYGSESGSQRILDAMERRVSVGQIRQVAQMARRYGIQIGLFVMLGYPGEEMSDIAATVEHLKQVHPDTFLTTVAYPIKGTDLFREVADRLEKGLDWAADTDRSIGIRGRFSDRFYWFANRYLVNEVGWFTQRSKKPKDILALTTSFVKAKLARLGMEVTKSSAS